MPFGSQAILTNTLAPKQKKDNWCWSAVASYIDTTLSGSVKFTQCQIAMLCLPAECNPDCAGDACDKTHYLNDALNKIKRNTKLHSGSLSITDVMYEIQNGRPIGVRIQWTEDNKADLDNGHFVAIFGFRVIGNNAEYLVYNPAKPDFGLVDEKKLVSNYELNGYWSETILLRDK